MRFVLNMGNAGALLASFILTSGCAGYGGHKKMTQADVSALADRAAFFEQSDHLAEAVLFYRAAALIDRRNELFKDKIADLEKRMRLDCVSLVAEGVEKQDEGALETAKKAYLSALTVSPECKQAFVRLREVEAKLTISAFDRKYGWSD